MPPYTRMMGEQLLTEKLEKMTTVELGAAKRLLSRCAPGALTNSFNRPLAPKTLNRKCDLSLT